MAVKYVGMSKYDLRIYLIMEEVILCGWYFQL